MALRILSYRGNETRASPSMPAASASAVSVVPIDSLPPPQNLPAMSQATLEAPGAQPTGPEADPAGLIALSTGAVQTTTDDSFLRHGTYYFKDGNIIFLVDGTLYCVHRYFFYRDSVYFSAKFAQLGVRDHESLRTIVSFGDIERNDFEALLSVIYPENFDQHNLSYEQWRSVLHLSTRWGFASLRKLALRSVKPPTPCDQLLLARTYGVDHWVLPALSALCERAMPISLKEARQMSIEDVVLVATVREDILNNRAQAEIPRQIEATQAMLTHVTGNDVLPAGFKGGASEKKLNSTEPVAAGQAAEGGSDNGSKTVASTSPAEDDKREGDGHLKAGAAASAMSQGENNKQDAEQQIQKATSDNNPDDRVEEHAPEIGDGTSEKGSKKTEDTGETRDDAGADKVKSEAVPDEVAPITGALTEEPQAQDQAQGQGRADEAAGPPARSQPAPAAEPQPPARATPLYWRRLTARYTAVAPQAS